MVYFKHLFNPEILVSLNLSSNWFGSEGLFEIKDELLRFKNLKFFALNTSKLCFGHPEYLHLANQLACVISNLKTIEVLELQENSINDKKF
jgi:hypothetical protein